MSNNFGECMKFKLKSFSFSLWVFLAISSFFSCGKSENSGDFTVLKDVNVGTFDPQLAKRGEELFKIKCSSCHKLDIRLVGPPLRDVVKRRSPDYIISMITNPELMQEKNDTVKALVQKYMTKMTNQNVSLDEAKAIYHYLKEISGVK